MPDVRKCAIYGCRSNSRDNKDLKFFNFPARDSPVYETWFTLCMESQAALTTIRRPYICSLHFNPDLVGFRRLAIGALPSLRLKAPPGFAEEENARLAAKEAEKLEKQRQIILINDCLIEWVKRAQRHSEFGFSLCTTRRELQRVGAEIRNLLGLTLTFTIDDYWLRKFRQQYLRDWDSVVEDTDQQINQSLDLVEIIKSLDPNAVISSEEEIEIMLEEEQKIISNNTEIALKKNKEPIPDKSSTKPPFEHYPPVNYSQANCSKMKPKKRSFKEALEEFYGISNTEDSDNNYDSEPEVKTEKFDSIDLSQDDEGCFDDSSNYSGYQQVKSEPIIDSYQQALEHLRPLEDFALREENYRAIGLLSTLEIIFKKSRLAS